MLSRISKIFILLLLVGCGTWMDPWHKSKSSGPNYSERVQEKLNLYCSLMPDTILPLDGDSLYFTGFARTACDKGDLSDYSTRPGRYQRWPTFTGIRWDSPNASGTGTQARSESSRDGYLAVLWNAWARGDRATLEAIRDWGKRRGWTMGDGRLGGVDTYFTPAFRSTLARLIYRLGGDRDLVEENLPVNWQNECEDYECWLTVTHILLRGEAFGAISGDAIAALKHASEYVPFNPLYKWAYDKYTVGTADSAIALALGHSKFPADRLPTDANYRDAWPLRRGPESRGWTPDLEGHETHSGGDWAFAAWLILRG